MKRLQNNFTTQEQSKRLLELGVPANSADMYYGLFVEAVIYTGYDDVPKGKTFYCHEPSVRHIDSNGTVCELKRTDIPCWSVGRLIEIFNICNCYSADCDLTATPQGMVDEIETAIMDDIWDFSKLKD